MRFKLVAAAALLGLLAASSANRQAAAFCGFYVAKADADLFNEASKVVIARHMDSTVLTMANDYKGDPREFAMVVPVPTFIEKGQIRVARSAIIDRLDRFTAPRLVEYFDSDPCPSYRYQVGSATQKMVGSISHDARLEDYGASLGVTVEAEYAVGEYDIVILSAEQSDGLETWLRANEYNIPDGASRVLGSYIRQGMRFFVAKVNLGAQAEMGLTQLRPLQINYDSPKFMLPIRLGTLNARGPQELFAFIITKSGQVESTNYRTVKLPTGMDLPPHIKSKFGDFYKAMFERQVEQHGMKTVFMEYAWNMSWCDPCADNPLSRAELEEAGVFWIGDNAESWGGTPGSNQAYVTRLHVRYTADTFPEDLQFQETSNASNFQGRYVLRHPWKGSVACAAGREYVKNLGARLDREAVNLASLTGWDVNDIRSRTYKVPFSAKLSSWTSWLWAPWGWAKSLWAWTWRVAWPWLWNSPLGNAIGLLLGGLVACFVCVLAYRWRFGKNRW